MDQIVAPNKKTAKSGHFKQLLLASLCAVIMACMVFFVFPKRPLSPGPVRVQNEQIAATIPPTPEIQTPAPTPEPTRDLSSTSYGWIAALNTVYKGSNGGIDGWYAEGHDPKILEWGTELGSNWSPTTTKLTTQILGSTTVVEGGAVKAYLLTQTGIGECASHPCSAVLGSAVLKKESDRWSVQSIQEYITAGGTFGWFWEAPTVIDIGKGHVAFLLLDDNEYQGRKDGSVTIYAYVKGMFLNVLEGGLSDNRDAYEGGPNQPAIHSTDTTFEPLPSLQEFYDIKLTRIDTGYSTGWKKTGDALDFKVIKVTRAVSIYSFNGVKYVKQAGN